MSKVCALFVLLLLLLFPPAHIAQAGDDAIAIEDRGVAVNFPDNIVFKSHVKSSAGIERIVLEYGVEQLSCVTVTAKALPNFEAGKSSADVSWTWEMRKSGSEPAGAKIWYRWRVGDRAGNERLTEKKEVVWLDRGRSWDSISSGSLTLHWYGTPREHAQLLLDSAVKSLERIEQTIGLKPQSPVDLYVFPNGKDLSDAVLYEPGWIGGLAYAEYGIVLIGIAPEETSWGTGALAHEIAHVLTGHATFSCISDVPSWLNEGISMFSEGTGLDWQSKFQLEHAASNNELISVRALSGEFSEHSDRAYLGYSESYSLVAYLIANFGQERLLTLLDYLRRGMRIDDALRAAYDMGLDELETEWRLSLDVAPAYAARPTPAASPNSIPTYLPAGNAPLASSAGTGTAPGVASQNGSTGAPLTTAPNVPGGARSESQLHPVTQVWVNALIAAGFSGLVAFFALWGLGRLFEPREI